MIETRKVLAVSSPGGHWVQLQRICRPLAAEVVYARAASTPPTEPSDVLWLPDANKDVPHKVLVQFARVVRLVLAVRPDLVISTGAAPGCLACVVARITGRKAIFVDSIANAEGLSLSARIAGACGVDVLSQWPELCDDRRVHHVGDVLGEVA